MNNKIFSYFQKLWCIYFRHTRKNNHIIFFLVNGMRKMVPKPLLRLCLDRKLKQFENLTAAEQQYILERVDYYCKFKENIFLPADAQTLKEFTYRKRRSYVNDYVNSTYFFDAYEYTRFFPASYRWAYNPGDVNYLFPLPEITKSRPIREEDGNCNNILLNLDKVRHFTWIYDPFPWETKECKILFRGDARNKPRRQRFIELWKDHELCDLVSTGKMSIFDHLKYKYIAALEGNDVASNLKWVMSSNSIAVMPRPTCETWYMEGKLIPDYHYIEIASDYHDLIEKIMYYEAHPKEALAIIRHAHEWVSQFQNKKREELISLMVLDKYFRLTGQKPAVDLRAVKHLPNYNYFINEIVRYNTFEKVNAQSKARKDVLLTFRKLGYRIMDVVNLKYSLGEGKRYHHYPLLSEGFAKFQTNQILKNIHFGDNIVIQDFYRKYLQSFAEKCIKKGANVVFVVHDVQSIRFNSSSKEIRKLNNSSMLLVHTQAMADKLKLLGVSSPMSVMWLFDYYSSDAMAKIESTIERKNEVVFAGNLAKSEFLRELFVDHSNPSLTFNLYGMINSSLVIPESSNFRYCGIFKPDHTGVIRGGWGLVWDGEGIDGCTGNLGEYLRYNSSHKTSLYLVCGMPIIVWDESSLANWVVENKIGITVPSLRNLEERLNSISREEYREYLINTHVVGEKLRHGAFLKNIIKHPFSIQSCH